MCTSLCFFIGVALFPTTMFSDKTPALPSIPSLAYWLIGHIAYGYVLGELITRNLSGIDIHPILDEEREQWLLEKAKIEENLPVYEKKIAEQLEVSLKELRPSVPTQPKWGIKKNSEGKNVFWYGFKCHLAVGTKSQNILQSLFSSGNLNDGKAAIPLLKGTKERLPLLKIKHVTMDAGYNYQPIYEQLYRNGAQFIIAYNKKRARVNWF